MLRGNILLVSNNSFLRRGLADSLATDTLSVAGEESALEAALALIRTGRPHVDVALIDLDSCNDAAALQEIALQQPQVSIVVITADPSQMAHTLAAEVRAKALLPNTVSAEALNLTLQLVILGEDLFLTTGTASEGTKPAARAPLQSGSAPQLSPREAEVLQFIKKGASNKLIARNLDVAEATVKVHVKSMLRKIDVENRTQAAVWALNHGDGANVPSAEDRAHTPRRVLLR